MTIEEQIEEIKRLLDVVGIKTTSEKYTLGDPLQVQPEGLYVIFTDHSHINHIERMTFEATGYELFSEKQLKSLSTLKYIKTMITEDFVNPEFDIEIVHRDLDKYKKDLCIVSKNNSICVNGDKISIKF